MTTPLTPVSYGAPALGGAGAVRSAMGGVGAAPQSSASGSTSTSPPAAPSALEAAVSAAAATQGGLAGLLADLEAALGAPDLPQTVQAAAAQVLGARLSIDPPPSAEDLRQAVAQSGLFLESQLAGADAPTEGDLKAALLSLAQALGDWSSGSSAPAGARAAPPAPPYPGGPLRGQPAAASALPPDATLEMIAGPLIRQTAGALARQVLMQAASAPQSADKTAEAPRDAHWLFELPLATPGGAAIAQFEIDRDGGRSQDGEDDARTWRVSFSLDLAGVGPVHARVALRGGQVRVALWAEDDATLAQLEAHKADLARALQDEDLSPQLVLFPGAPAPKPPGAGRFMDHAV